MSQTEAFAINRTAILYEQYGDEVVAINNSNGHYYSLSGISADIWALLERGATLQAVVEHVELRYSGQHGEIQALVSGFVDELLKEGLIMVTDAATLAEEVRLPVPQEQLPLETPRLEVYSDMQDLLLLDPIHEVDETGWPNKPRQE